MKDDIVFAYNCFYRYIYREHDRVTSLECLKLRIKRLLKLSYDSNLFLFTFSYPCNGRESIVFGSNFRNGDFDGFTLFEVP